ncbi:MAG: isoprenylcysteine carboxylmethyltransferase family protein [Lautropia sp.]|nr:isoprenylcysteine carboxylmethyltransferase family protein [Lautropia sp.]
MMRSLELKIPPPLVFLLAGLIMYGLRGLVPAATWSVPGRVYIALFMLAWGCLIGALGLAAFHAHRTSYSPKVLDRTNILVTRGIYRQTRNPMYLGLLFVLIGWAVYLSNFVSLLGLPLFVWYMNRFQIEPEERALEAKFGNAYFFYVATVKRWLF